ncbi:MAG: signal peptide peptidase SppA [Bradymonadaceae bacterium]|nr:signal peptide peptidase SppA [Lujinxingiaceae bacterium]
MLGQAVPSPSDGLALPDRSITTQDDATSLEVNPAGLGFMRSGELSYGFSVPTDDFRGVVNQGHGLFMAAGTGGLGLGFGVQWLHRPELGPERATYRKYTLGAALGAARLMSFGANLNFFGSRNDQRLNELATWDFGLQWRPSAYFGLGLLARDVNAAFLDEDQALPRRIGAGAVFRLWEGRLVLDAEITRVQGSPGYSLSPRFVVEPLAGLRLFTRGVFDVDTEAETTQWEFAQLNGGLELSFGNLGMQGAGIFNAFDNDGLNYAGQSYLFWMSPNKRRSLIDPGGRWLQIDLDESIAEQATSRILGTDTRAFLSLLQDLEAIARDPGVSGVVFNIGSTSLGYAQMWELRQHIVRLQEAGKHTISLLRDSSTRALYLSSATAEVWMPPSTTYFPTGLSAQFINYAQALENIGIQAEFVRIGDYKTAPESYIKTAPSDEALEQTGQFLDAIFGEVTSAVAGRRGLEQSQVVQLFDRVPLMPHEAVRERFVDELVYFTEIEARLTEKHQVRGQLERGYTIVETADERWGTRPKIAIVYIDGIIVEGGSGQTPFSGDLLTGSETIVRVLDSLRRDNNVRAVVVRIDSPGGSAMGSDIIFRKIRELAQTKPVVASMGNIAASGGYYVAAGANEIFATPVTLTGSIGIFAGKFNVDRLTTALGVSHSRLQRGQVTGIFNLLDPWSEAERAAISSSINFMYRVFLNQVAQTRPLTAEQVDVLGRGRVWTGTAAHGNQLVDQLGGLMDAIRRAEQLAGLEPAQAEYAPYPGPRALLGGPIGVQAQAILAALLPSLSATAGDSLRERSAAKQLLRNIESSVLLPLLFGPGEALMLPPQAISLD